MCKIFFLVFTSFMFACEAPNGISTKTNSSTRLEGSAEDNRNHVLGDMGAEIIIKETMSPSEEPLLFLLFKYDR